MTPEKRIVLPVAWITALCLLGDSMLYIVLPLYWETFGLEGLWQAGILLSVNRLVRLPLNPLIGYCYAKMPKAAGIALACVPAVAATFAYGWLKGFWLLLAVRCLWGIAWGFLRLGGYLAVMEAAPETRRGRGIGLYNGIWGIGSLTGMLAGGWLTDRFGLAQTSLVFGLLNMAALPLCLLLLQNERKLKQERANGCRETEALETDARETEVPAAHRPPAGAPLSARSRGRLHAAAVLLGGLTVGIVFFGLYSSSLSQLIRFRFGDTVQWAGYAAGAATAAGLLQALRWAWGPFLGPLAGLWSDRSRNKPRLSAGSFAAAAFLMLAAVLPMPAAMWTAAVLLLQLANTLLSNLADAAAADTAERNGRVGMMTAYTMAIDLGAAIGPAAGLPLIAVWGLKGVYGAAALLLLVSAGVWTLAGRSETRYTG